ncbi:MAG TPA: CDP-alcohol phosphatidyltransferase family protein [Bacteroidota bacterium]|nr:CDP-alcohol phosphatidyltransferase family protein [Bacteroidota bacterium]
MKDRIWTLSNGLSLLRILLVVPVGILLVSGNPDDRLYAAGLIAIAVLTDFLDGLIARMKNEVTLLGKIIDPVADKVGIGALALILTAQGTLPLWFTLAVVGRDLAILAAAYILSRKGEAMPQSNRTGKWAAGVMGMTVLIAVVDPANGSGVLVPSIAASALMIALSSISYAKRFSR